ncbi:hypothetical protein [Polaromonas glacialis]|uniref:hypothetical protein n=1 Tax=Polaromonas glacialis TaxID=866564 RepID=UPI0012EC5757|nr:hypothetical protein [Polaromonas glacialis]
MRALRPQWLVINALVAQTAFGGTGLLDKDEHLADALRALVAWRLSGIYLAFCGGAL